MPSLDDEDPDVPVEALSRRSFLKLVGAGSMLAACAQRPARNIFPYNDPPPELTPGVPQRYATSIVHDGFATGLLVTSHTGRPTKIEGHPAHPHSLGATSAVDQAAILELYDPHRARGVSLDGEPRDWLDLTAALLGDLQPGGAGLRFLLDPSGSPLEAALLGSIRAALPEAGFTFLGARRPVLAHPDLSRADVVLSLGADFLGGGPDSLRLSRQWSERRRQLERMNRMWVVETAPTPTGSVADHRLRARPSEVHAIAAAVLAALEPGSAAPDGSLRALVADLRAANGRAVVLAGDEQPDAVHAIAQRINAALAAPVVYRASPLLEGTHDLATLARDLHGGQVRTLVILGWNPVYQAPADLGFAEAMRRATTIYLGRHRDETAAAARWFVPALHFLESWGDARAYDGTVSFVQPLVEPLFGFGKSAADLLAVVADRTPDTSVHDLLRAAWVDRAPWPAALARGFVDGTALPPIAPPASQIAPPPPSGGIEIALVRDCKVGDGRHANNAWLQELPAPMTKLAWDNAALLSPRTAAELRVERGDHLELELGGRKVVAPVLVAPGHAEGAVTLALGYGRAGDEEVARGVGVDAGRLRTTTAPSGGPGTARRVRGHTELAVTQGHDTTEGRPIALEATVAEYRAHGKEVTADQIGPLPTLLRDQYTEQLEQQWAMSIDLSLCTGCSACVIACQAENNIPVVGKSGVLRSREMHWLRIDRYYAGPAEEPTIVSQPMMCQHCEKAPCEYVCPVNATVHSADGLNEMVYNRCIGTRFCSNNCPYKVRRFNFFSYVKRDLTALQKNPNVTVRQRGVMEKCTYCVQRIRSAEIEARVAGRALGGNDVVTACQQACPTRAITFGSLHDPESDVSKLRREARAYEALHELGIRPRTRYLVKLRNPAEGA